MTVRYAVLLLCVFLRVGLGQNPARIFVQGIGERGPDYSFSATELGLLPPRTIAITDGGKPVTFQGVLLTDMLAKVATPTGDRFHHTAASYYLVAEGSDGYRAVFAWAEIDPSFTEKAVYVVTERDGKPLRENDGPFELIVPGEKRNARWVRHLAVLRVEPNPTPYGSEQARWIRENLPELESIKAGMTRTQLLKVFMEEGGISTRRWERYVYRKCGYVKVDVEFEPVGDPSPGEGGALPHLLPNVTGPALYGKGQDDVITKISKPYLELSILD